MTLYDIDGRTYSINLRINPMEPNKLVFRLDDPSVAYHKFLVSRDPSRDELSMEMAEAGDYLHLADRLFVKRSLLVGGGSFYIDGDDMLVLHDLSYEEAGHDGIPADELETFADIAKTELESMDIRDIELKGTRVVSKPWSYPF